METPTDCYKAPKLETLSINFTKSMIMHIFNLFTCSIRCRSPCKGAVTLETITYLQKIRKPRSYFSCDLAITEVIFRDHITVAVHSVASSWLVQHCQIVVLWRLCSNYIIFPQIFLTICLVRRKAFRRNLSNLMR